MSATLPARFFREISRLDPTGVTDRLLGPAPLRELDDPASPTAAHAYDGADTSSTLDIPVRRPTNAHRPPPRRRDKLRTIPRFGTNLLVIVALVATIAGTGTYIYRETVGFDPETPTVSEQNIVDARAQLKQTRFMFGLMSGAVTNATGGLTQVTSAIPDIFDSVTRARDGAVQISSAVSNAPRLSGLASQVSGNLNTITGALNQLQSVKVTAGQADSALSSLIASMKNAPPSARQALEPLQSALRAAKQLELSTASLGNLQAQVASITNALGSSASQVDGALAQAQGAADELQTGLNKILTARPKAESAAKDLTSGINQLSGVLSTMDKSLAGAEANLTPPAGSKQAGPANPLAWALGAGALGGLVALGLLSLLALRRNKGDNGLSLRRRPQARRGPR